MPDISKSGFIQVKNHSIYFEIYGKLESNKVPLIVLHGGPGGSHNYMLPLAKLSKHFPIVFYDQLGTGRSQIPTSDYLYSMNYFIDELNQVQKQLDLGAVNILGHSWGGMLTIEYLRSARPKVQKIILASSMIDSQLYNREAMDLVKKLDNKYPRIVKMHLHKGTYSSQECVDIYETYYKKHIFRKKTRPTKFKGYNSNMHQYNKMWGPNEMAITGSLKNWSGLKILPGIKQETLVISGQFDELTPKTNRLTAKLIPEAKSVIIPNSSHLAHIEQTTKYLKAIKTFLDE
jgi:proline iminopeptidase